MRITIPPEAIQIGKEISLPAGKSHYLRSVMRCREGDAVTVIDGRGRTYEAVITKRTRNNLGVVITREMPSLPEPPLCLVLCQALLKGEKMDLVIQKATELGIGSIQPLVTERCLVRETRRVERLRKIAEEAAEQCGRASVPAVHEPVALSPFLNGSATGNEGLRGFIFWEQEGLPLGDAVRQLKGLRDSHAAIHLLVGPEGGFSEDEAHEARHHGLIVTTLGKRTLRAETAAIVSVALVGFLIGEMSGPDSFCTGDESVIIKKT